VDLAAAHPVRQERARSLAVLQRGRVRARPSRRSSTSSRTPATWTSTTRST
jgi:hypothetical protein